MNEISERHAHHPVHDWIQSATDSVQSLVVPSASEPSVVATSFDVPSRLSSASSVDDKDNDGHESTLNGTVQEERRVLFEEYWNAARGESCTYYASPKEEAALLDWIGERDGNECTLLTTPPDWPICNERSVRENDQCRIIHFATFDSSSPVSWSPKSPRNLARSLERPAATTVRARSVSESSAACSQRSCLRRSRFALNVSRQESSSSSLSEASVSFRPRVEIVIYDIPVEPWTEEEWMVYFA
jgi:hypothetical protein